MDISSIKIPWYATVGASVALAAAVLGGFFYFVEQPLQADLTIRQQKLDSLRADISAGMTTAKKLQPFRAQVNDLEARLADLRLVLPEEKDAADLLRRMQTVAAQANLTITNFKPQPTVARQLHVEWPIVLELDGNYHNLAIFLDRIGRFTRIVNISALDIKGKDKPGQNSSITVSCVATTYVLLDKPAQPAGQPTQPASHPAAAPGKGA